MNLMSTHEPAIKRTGKEITLNERLENKQAKKNELEKRTPSIMTNPHILYGDNRFIKSEITDIFLVIS